MPPPYQSLGDFLTAGSSKELLLVDTVVYHSTPGIEEGITLHLDEITQELMDSNDQPVRNRWNSSPELSIVNGSPVRTYGSPVRSNRSRWSSTKIIIYIEFVSMMYLVQSVSHLNLNQHVLNLPNRHSTSLTSIGWISPALTAPSKRPGYCRNFGPVMQMYSFFPRPEEPDSISLGQAF
jgi:hypothetical protein